MRKDMSLRLNKGQVDHVGTSFRCAGARLLFFFFDKQSHNGCGARFSRAVPLSVGHSNVLTTSWHLVKNSTVEKKNSPCYPTVHFSLLHSKVSSSCPRHLHPLTTHLCCVHTHNIEGWKIKDVAAYYLILSRPLWTLVSYKQYGETSNFL